MPHYMGELHHEWFPHHSSFGGLVAVYDYLIAAMARMYAEKELSCYWLKDHAHLRCCRNIVSIFID